MVKENLANLVNNKKPIELVQEIDNKYHVPSFEEFLKTYKNDSDLNYADLESSDVGSSKKRYGPCIPPNPNCRCTADQLREQIKNQARWFRLNISAKSIAGLSRRRG